jgi:hypothetical protein
VRFERSICLACVADVFMRQLGLSQKTAQAEIRRYTPSLEELRTESPSRPFFTEAAEDGRCPYSGSPAKWHAQLTVYRIESGKATDALRRELVKSLPDTGGKFVVLEEKATQQQAFFEWLEAASVHLDFDDPNWLMQASMRYLGRKEPKVDWQEQFRNVRSIRRSRFLEEGWEVDNGRLFLAPVLFDELLLVQYLLSRSHKAGGLTLEGRYTLAFAECRLSAGRRCARAQSFRCPRGVAGASQRRRDSGEVLSHRRSPGFFGEDEAAPVAEATTGEDLEGRMIGGLWRYIPSKSPVMF